MFKCPKCVQVIHAGAQECPHCGFVLAQLDSELGDGEVVLPAVSDQAGVLRKRHKVKMLKELQAFEKQFPQLFAVVHFTSMPHGISIRQYGFWLLNRLVLKDTGVDKANERGILITVDVTHKMASITHGYFLDPFLSEPDEFKVLTRAHPFLAEGDMVLGMKTILRGLRAVLRKKARKANRDPEAFAVKRGAKSSQLPRLRKSSSPVSKSEQKVEEAAELGSLGAGSAARAAKARQPVKKGGE